MQQNPNALPNGTFLQSGKYHILETIGSGGFGITYLVENRHTKQQQVIKELFLSVSGMTCTREGTNLVFYTTNPKFQFSRFKENFRKEAGVLLKLKKVTGVVNVIAIFEENDTIYFAMDWIDGQNLQQWTSEKNDRSSPYYIEQCVVWAMNAAFIVHGVHREGVLHRDIKPQNMMVVPKTGQLVLIDFGIARDFVEGETQTQTAMQSPGYSPPEQWELKAQRGAYTDVYSLGATLYFLLTGRTPPENSDQRIVRKGLDGGWEPIHFNKNIPEGLNAIIIHAMQPDKTNRIQTALDLHRRLEPFSGIINANNPDDEPQPPPKNPHTHLFAILVLLLFASLFFFVAKPYYKKHWYYDKYDASYYDGLKAVKYKGKWGYIDGNGNEVIAPKYEDCLHFSSGLAAVKNEENWGYINKKDSLAIPFNYQKVYYFYGDFAPVKQNDKWAYIDKYLRISIGWTRLDDFGKEGLYPIYKGFGTDSQFGYSDTLGNIVLEPIYQTVNWYFVKGFSRAKKEEKWGFLNRKCEAITPFKYDELYGYQEGMAGCRIDTLYGFIDSTGKEITLKYQYIRDFKEGFAVAKYQNKYGAIDKKGTIIVPFAYKEVADFSEHIARVMKENPNEGNEYGFVNDHGRLITPIIYQHAEAFSEGRALVKYADKYGFVDAAGAEVIRCQYDRASDFSYGRALIFSNNKCGFIDKTGRIVISLKYSGAGNFHEGMAYIYYDGNSDRKYSFVNINGQEIAPFQYDGIRDFQDGLAAVNINGKWGFIDKNGKFRIDAKFDQAFSFDKNTHLASVTENGTQKWINKEGYCVQYCK